MLPGTSTTSVGSIKVSQVTELMGQAMNNGTGVASTGAPNAVPVPGGTATKVGWAGTNVIYVGSGVKLVVYLAMLFFTVRVPGKVPVAVRVGLSAGAGIGILAGSSREL